MQLQAAQRASWARRIRRAGAIATVVVLVVCTVGVQAREAAIPHVRCQEHGQLVHVHGVVPDSVGDHAVGVAHVPSRGAFEADHEHCPMGGTVPCTSCPAVAPAVSIVAAVADPQVPRTNAHVAVATLRMAPKTSPPI